MNWGEKATIDLKGAMQLLGMSQDSLRDFVATQQVPGAAKIGRKWMFIKADLVRCFMAHEQASAGNGVVYIIEDAAESPVKIGFTCGGLVHRVAALQQGNPRRLRVARAWPGTLMMERVIHRLLAPWRLHNEWFSRCPQVGALIDLRVPCLTDAVNEVFYNATRP